jgi:NAD(P)-dependent dehydrogenase (short-subunit alcohol dehydrogenase family)
MSCHSIPDEIVTETGNEQVIVRHVDLSSQQSVRDFAREVLSSEKRLDVLILNAAYAGVFRKAKSVDGIELTMATNHYGSFLLTNLLINLMKKTSQTSPCRIVVVSSKLHHVSTMHMRKDDFNPISGPQSWFPGQIYHNSKFCNILFTFELAKRLRHYNITANCLHPGLTDSNIWRNYPVPMQILLVPFKFFLKSPMHGAKNVLYVTLSERLKGISGKYWKNCHEARPNARALNKQWQTSLWEESKKIVKLTRNDPQI